MIKDHRPFFVKKMYQRIEASYVRRFLAPQLESLGPGFTFMKPWHVEIFGWPISIGRSVNVIATADMKVRLSVAPVEAGQGRIRIGDYCLICPGVRISAATEIRIADNSMVASGAYITDSDWHDIYNRVIPCIRPAPIVIEENVWIGDSAIVCKGVHIGRNSVVGAGSVVVDDVPDNAIAAGNPARVVRWLDSTEKIVTRADWFNQHGNLDKEIDFLNKQALRGNSIGHWLRHMFFPNQGE